MMIRLTQSILEGTIAVVDDDLVVGDRFAGLVENRSDFLVGRSGGVIGDNGASVVDQFTVLVDQVT